MSRFLPLIAALAIALPASAVTPDTLQREYDAAAKQESPAWAGPSAQRGGSFFRSTHGRDWSCASCHTADPRQSGRHARTQNAIAPMAPAVNAERLTDAAKVEKWFRRNCSDVVGRACTAAEKADVLAFLRSPQ